MGLHLLLPGNAVDPRELHKSPMASARLRLAPTVNAATQLGWSVTAGDRPGGQVNTLLVGKIGATEVDKRAPRWLEVMAAVREGGGKVILDYTDHHLATGSSMTAFYKAACQTADAICVPTSALAEVLTQDFKLSAEIRVVPDMLEYEQLEPSNRAHQGKLRGMWFGHPSNAHFLAQFLDNLPSSLANHELIVVSAPQTLEVLKRYPFTSPPTLPLAFQPWSVAAVRKVAAQTDFCIIPSDLNSPKRFASNNRLVTALALGLPTAATGLPSYAGHSAYFAELGSERALRLFHDPCSEHGVIREFQRHWAAQYTKAKVVERWSDLLMPQDAC